MACVATWSFGLQAVRAASAELEGGASCLDALEKGINAVEDDPTTGKFYVGRGCYPNSAGVVQLDAGLMRGRDCAYGGVAGLERFARPLSVARRLLERPGANLLVGGGATEFAQQEGFAMEENATLMTSETRQAYLDYQEHHKLPTSTGHDTLSLLCQDGGGAMAVGVSTSGPPFKPPGRVGDSPLPGCGLYADDLAGAAAATGDGEVIMRFSASFHVVLLMRGGLSAEAACGEVVRRMLEECGRKIEVALIALDTKGHAGTAATVREWRDFRDEKVYDGFPYATWRQGSKPEILVQPPTT